MLKLGHLRLQVCGNGLAQQILTDDVLADLSDLCDDAPTTPAPVFAARAFKQLLWGTPKLEEGRPATSQPRRRTSAPKPRTKSLAEDENAAVDETGPSTPKSAAPKRPGILLTPGTGGTRRKTVSFERKISAAQKDAAQLDKHVETPKVNPGRFPSPVTVRSKPADVAEPAATAESKQVLTTTATGYAEPQTEEGRYWKSQYDSFLAKSTMEMKKLAKKEQVAKKFARYKDNEATKLAESLQREHARVEILEKQVAEYVTQLKLATAQGNQVATKDARERVRRSSQSDDRPTKPSASLAPAQARGTEGKAVKAQGALLSHQPPVQHAEAGLQRQETTNHANEPPTRTRSIGPISRPQSVQKSPARSRSRGRARGRNEEVGSDIWADMGDALDALNSPQPAQQPAAQPQKKPPLEPRSVNVQEEPRMDLEWSKESKMSLERREAALKRLEERRRNREKGVQ